MSPVCFSSLQEKTHGKGQWDLEGRSQSRSMCGYQCVVRAGGFGSLITVGGKEMNTKQVGPLELGILYELGARFGHAIEAVET